MKEEDPGVKIARVLDVVSELQDVVKGQRLLLVVPALSVILLQLAGADSVQKAIVEETIRRMAKKLGMGDLNG